MTACHQWGAKSERGQKDRVRNRSKNKRGCKIAQLAKDRGQKCN